MTLRILTAVLRARFDATLRGYRDIRPGGDMLALFAALDRAIVDVERKLPPAEPAWLQAATGHRAPLPAAVPVVATHVRCPRCLRPDAERADVERTGVCYDCDCAGYGRSQEPAPVAVDAVAIEASPPEADGAALPDVATGAGVVQLRVVAPPEGA